MKRQNDWYTGIDYYENSKEKQINVREKVVDSITDLCIHEQVIILFVKSGEGIIEINGTYYPLKEGSFLCLYMHHFYRFTKILKPLNIIEVNFYIGNFMFMCFEKHPMNANATLVYDTIPFVQLNNSNFNRISRLIDELLLEIEEQRFSSMNMVIYLTLQLHAYFCRFAFENVTENKDKRQIEWDIIPKIILSTEKNINLSDFAKEVNLSETHLNQRIKNACGLTYFQLNKFGKIINACALLHFPELSMDYISDILNFSSKNSFYRVFNQYVHMTPKEYQEKCVFEEEYMLNGYGGSALMFLQYIHINFMNEISLKSLANEFFIKEYTAKLIFENVFKVSFQELLEQTRIAYACSFLSSTNKSVTEISNLCRFDSISTFQRAFTKHMNQSPTEYRKLTNTSI
ncbi:AraC family transcriptional regulator [Clostridium swellfunianum]|uniref:AraC family transcriptional regulator n=1 Tax=Clostridium swellfunianum TaxID=1367462 RepID=UPI00202FD8E8|nr:AraC family transcriptional regulator [Clostridium swellfunianum]MCM0651009.1 AraC family transcriptional regulator [Clostridium swellfunianum]